MVREYFLVPSFIESLMSWGKRRSFNVLSDENCAKLVLYCVHHFWTTIRTPHVRDDPSLHQAHYDCSKEMPLLQRLEGVVVDPEARARQVEALLANSAAPF